MNVMKKLVTGSITTKYQEIDYIKALDDNLPVVIEFYKLFAEKEHFCSDCRSTTKFRMNHYHVVFKLDIIKELSSFVSLILVLRDQIIIYILYIVTLPII